MATNITINGANYPSVPSIIVPKTGGGQAQFYDMSDPMSFLGLDVELMNGNSYSFSDTLDNTDYATWTPSTTAKTIVTSKSTGTFATDLANYAYYIVWECGCTPTYTGTPTLKAHLLFSRAYIVHEIMKRPATWGNIQNDEWKSNNCVSLYASNFLRYYNANGAATFTWSGSNGIYFTAPLATFSSSGSDTPIVTINSPNVLARCSTSYFSTSNAALVDQANSPFFIRGKVYRIKQGGIINHIYHNFVDLINE